MVLVLNLEFSKPYIVLCISPFAPPYDLNMTVTMAQVLVVAMVREMTSLMTLQARVRVPGSPVLTAHRIEPMDRGSRTAAVGSDN